MEFTKQTRLASSQYPPGPGLCLSAYRLGGRELLLTSEPFLQPLLWCLPPTLQGKLSLRLALFWSEVQLGIQEATI